MNIWNFFPVDDWRGKEELKKGRTNDEETG